MSKYILIPDSFKLPVLGGDMRHPGPRDPGPGAGGGDLLHSRGGRRRGHGGHLPGRPGRRKIPVSCRDPYGRAITACYGLLPDGGTAVIEMAAAAGLPLVGDDRRAADATTYGVGQLMAHALERGAKRIVLGLGGSATNDGGCGAAAALGVKFLDEADRAFVPVGGTLHRIARIRTDGLMPRLLWRRRSLPCATLTIPCVEKTAQRLYSAHKRR